MARLVDKIRNGDKVTIVNTSGKKITGRAVMRSSMKGCWVLNTGGRYGQPALACDINVVKVSKRRKS